MPEVKATDIADIVVCHEYPHLINYRSYVRQVLIAWETKQSPDLWLRDCGAYHGSEKSSQVLTAAKGIVATAARLNELQKGEASSSK